MLAKRDLIILLMSFLGNLIKGSWESIGSSNGFSKVHSIIVGAIQFRAPRYPTQVQSFKANVSERKTRSMAVFMEGSLRSNEEAYSSRLQYEKMSKQLTYSAVS